MIITSNGEETKNTITISSSDDVTANVTIKDVNIKNNGDAINIDDKSTVEITLEGTNKLHSDYGSALHIADDSDLTITSSEDKKGSLEATTGNNYSGEYNENDNATIGSHSDEEMSSDIHITGSATVTATASSGYSSRFYHDDGAAIGSGAYGNMSGDITIDGSAQVTAGIGNEGTGAAIGSGASDTGIKADMTGTITIGGNAQVTATGQKYGAGIGSGWASTMSGEITIKDDATVTATGGIESAGIGVGFGRGTLSGTITIEGNADVASFGNGGGAGIGSGYNNGLVDSEGVRGNINIGGNAQVTAWSKGNGAGIGSSHQAGGDMTTTITIRDNAKVTAGSNDSSAGIGSGNSDSMDGTIIIQDEAEVTAIAGNASAIGSGINNGTANKMTGIIVVLGDAKVTTGVRDSLTSPTFSSSTRKFTYTLKEDTIGYIGSGSSSDHTSNTGHYVLGSGANINGQGVSGDSLSGDDIKALQNYINMYLSGEDHNGEPQNLTLLQVSEENGAFSVNAYGEGHLGKIFYDGKEEVPTDPGKYSVTIELTFDDGKAVTLKVGTLEIPDLNAPTDPGDSTNPGDKNDPEDKNDPTNPTTPTDPTTPGEELVDLVNENTASEPLYRVTNKNGWDIVHKAERKNGVLTITVNEDYANLTGALSGISTLEAQGVEKIVFVTNEATSAFKTADLLKQGGSDTTYKFTHNGAAVTFVAGSTDVSGILIK